MLNLIHLLIFVINKIFLKVDFFCVWFYLSDFLTNKNVFLKKKICFFVTWHYLWNSLQCNSAIVYEFICRVLEIFNQVKWFFWINSIFSWISLNIFLDSFFTKLCVAISIATIEYFFHRISLYYRRFLRQPLVGVRGQSPLNK